MSSYFNPVNYCIDNLCRVVRHSIRHRYNLRRMVLLLVVLGGLGVSHYTHAAGNAMDCDYTGTYYIFGPSTTLRVPPNTAVGDTIGSWITFPASGWQCKILSTSMNDSVKAGIGLYSPYSIDRTIDIDGSSHSVFSYTGKAGLGYALRFRATGAGFSSDWKPMNGYSAANMVYSSPLLGPIPYNNSSAFNLNVEVQIRFVKTATTLTTGWAAAFDPAYAYNYRTYNNGTSNGTEIFRYRLLQFPERSLNIQLMTQTCTTPDVTVNLPDVGINQFKGIGDVKGLKAFNLNFNNCPGGLEGIHYKFGATSSVLNAANGVVALDSSSTAKGVGVLLRSQSNMPITLNTEYTLSGYNASSIQSYTVPMNAGIYQTENTVKSGTVKGAFTFTLIYK
ncbi:P pilus assembly protein, pilin FimA [Budvicia aquatica]|uniref:P pilus assembly protein, pilin FimA n=2 Tax=Budvicia aquatica TaxID=82979 RepID=A0A2C6C048_9GAMM|nr:type 1 fimbrial protein [Budvicia aquatica]VFS48149.1 P pilus assembly protein, pilin FimA [Budvicia aquatica]